jgi:hypothetical protein
VCVLELSPRILPEVCVLEESGRMLPEVCVLELSPRILPEVCVLEESGRMLPEVCVLELSGRMLPVLCVLEESGRMLPVLCVLEESGRMLPEVCVLEESGSTLPVPWVILSVTDWVFDLWESGMAPRAMWSTVPVVVSLILSAVDLVESGAWKHDVSMCWITSVRRREETCHLLAGLGVNILAENVRHVEGC